MLIAFPVLPLLASTMVSPGRSSPSRSARSIMYFAMRALIDPEGLRYSSLTHIPSTMTSGVSPIASRIVPPPRPATPTAGSRAAPAAGPAAPSRASRAAERVLFVAFMPAPSAAGHWVYWPVPRRSTFPADGRQCSWRGSIAGARHRPVRPARPAPPTDQRGLQWLVDTEPAVRARLAAILAERLQQR